MLIFNECLLDWYELPYSLITNKISKIVLHDNWKEYKKNCIMILPSDLENNELQVFRDWWAVNPFSLKLIFIEMQIIFLQNSKVQVINGSFLKNYIYFFYI